MGVLNLISGSILLTFSKRLPCVRHCWRSSRVPHLLSGFCCVSLDVGTRGEGVNVREVVEITRVYIVRQSQSCVISLFK